MITREFRHDVLIYLLGMSVIFFHSAFDMLALTVSLYSDYLGAMIATGPIWIISAAQLYMMHAVFYNSVDHKMDQDWWMAVFFLGPVGVLLYYLAREDVI